MKTISEKLRDFAQLGDTVSWTSAQYTLSWDILCEWRILGKESLDDLNFNEWILFILFVAEALETP